jgi:hypothetical protein
MLCSLGARHKAFTGPIKVHRRKSWIGNSLQKGAKRTGSALGQTSPAAGRQDRAEMKRYLLKGNKFRYWV